MRTILLVLAGVLISEPLSARLPPAGGTLEAIRALDCEFSAYATVVVSDTDASAQVQPRFLSIAFEHIESREGTAEMTGMAGHADVIARLATHALHFIQINTTGGSLAVTTVFDDRTPGMKLKAVHTRHEMSDDASSPDPRPAQYYGACEVVR